MRIVSKRLPTKAKERSTCLWDRNYTKCGTELVFKVSPEEKECQNYNKAEFHLKLFSKHVTTPYMSLDVIFPTGDYVLEDGTAPYTVQVHIKNMANYWTLQHTAAYFSSNVEPWILMWCRVQLYP